MSKTVVDERVVQMKFDNKDFEQNTKTTMSTLEKLKQSLNLSGATKGMENINAAAKSVNLTGIGTAIDTVQMKFSALEVMAVTALANITNSALEAGKRMIGALTIEPMKTGFNEYETQINAVQTIMANTASKGTNLEQVNRALDELNTYADKTIYNFTEMTKNIGTFTAAGVDLDTSVSAIQGIANLAAVSGSNAQQAAVAMYQLSQALASGTVKLMDWNSVVNAGMGGEVFQNALKDTAKLHGVAIDQMIKNEGSFRETLKNEWLTTDILTETLKKFTTSGVNEYISKNSELTAENVKQIREQSKSNEAAADAIAKKSKLNKEEIQDLLDLSKTAEEAATKVKTFTQLKDTIKEAVQSGWSQSWRLIVGDFEEAKTFFTGLSDTFGGIISQAADARNNLLKGALDVKNVTTEDWNSIIASGKGIKDFQNALKDTARVHGIAIDDMIASAGSFKNSLKNGWLSFDILKETLDGIDKSTTTSTGNITQKLKELESVAKSVIKGNWGNGAERKKSLSEAGHDYEKIQGLVNQMLKDTSFNLDKLSAEQLKALGFTSEQSSRLKELAKTAKETGTPLAELMAKMEKPSGRELLLGSFKNLLDSVMLSIGAVGKAWREVFPRMQSDQLYNIIEMMHNFSENVLSAATKDADKLQRTLRGLFSILGLVTDIFGGGLHFAIKLVSKLLGIANLDILSLTANIGDTVYYFREWLYTSSIFADGLNYTIDVIIDAIKWTQEWINAFVELPEVQRNIVKFNKVFGDSMIEFQEYIDGGILKILEFVNRVDSLDHIGLDNIQSIFKDFRDNVVNYFFDIDDRFKGMKSVLKGFETSARKYFDETTKDFDGIKKKVIDFITFVNTKFSSINLGNVLSIGVGIAFIAIIARLAKGFKYLAGTIFDFASRIDGILAGVSKVLKSVAFKNNAAGIKDIAISIGILAASLALLTILDQDKLANATKSIGILAGGLYALALATSKLQKIGPISGVGVTILSLATSVLVLTIALKDMESLDPELIKRNLLMLAGITVGLAGVMVAIGKFMPIIDKSKKISRGSLFVLAFAGSLKIMVSALKDLDTIDFKNVKEDLIMLAASVGSLAAIALATSGLTFGSAAGVLAVSTSLLILVKAFDAILGLDVNKVKSNLENFVVIFGSMAGIMIASNLAGVNAAKGGIAVLAVSAAMFLIVEVFKRIADVDPLVFQRALDGVTQISAVFAAIIASTYFAGPNAIKAGVMLLMMAGSMAALGVVISVLSLLDKDGLGRATAAVVVLEGMMMGLIAITKYAQTSKTIIPMLVTLAVTFAMMAMAIGALSMIDANGLKAATIALSSVLAFFSLLVGVSSLAGGSIPVILVLGVLVAEFAVILYALSGLPVDNVLGVSQGLSTLLLSLSASLLILSGVGVVWPAALIGIGCLEAFILAIGAFTIGVAALVKQFPELEVLLNQGIPLLNKIGTALGGFFGGIASEFLKTASSSFPEIGSNLSGFMKNAKPFFDGIKNIDESSAKGVKTLAETIFILTASDLLSRLTSFIPGVSSLTTFGKEIAKFGKSFAEYAKSVEGIEPKVVENSAAAAKTLAEFAHALPNSGGLVSLFTGDNHLYDFAMELAMFGPAFKLYSDSIQGLSYSAVTNSAAAATTLAEFAKIVPNAGGLVSTFTGDNKLYSFGMQLALFGPCLKQYSDSLAGFSYSTVVNSAAAAKYLTEFAASVSNSGGIASLFAGDNTLDRFGAELVLFGLALKGYSDSVIGINADGIKNSVIAARHVTTLANLVPNGGGLAALFEGDNNISTFGFYLKSFGQYLRDYSDIVSGVDVTILESVTTQVRGLIALAQNMSTLNPEGMANFGVALTTMATDGLNGFITAFNNAGPTIIFTAQTMLSRFVLGLTLNKHKVTNTALIIVSDTVTSVRTKYNDFFLAGVYMVDGFANGITANTFKARAVAKAMAEAALDAARKALDEHSPSKKAYQIGDYFGIGYVNAIADNITNAYTAGKNIAKASLDGVKETINKLSTAVNSNVDVQPTIKPVLDLSDVKVGAGLLADMLSSKKAVTVSADINKTKSDIQNGNNGVTSKSTVVNYTQNNYSPKPLSRIAIYRQTNNQLSAMRDALA